MVVLLVRLLVSLAVVVGLLLLLTRLSARRLRGSRDALVRVVHRQALSRGSSVAVVTVGSRVLVVGMTEHQVQLLTELDPEELLDSEALLDATEPADLTATDEPALPGVPEEPEAPLAPVAALPSRTTARAAGRHARTADTALAGSLLSAQTWRQAYAAATGRVQDAS